MVVFFFPKLEVISDFEEGYPLAVVECNILLSRRFDIAISLLPSIYT